VVDEFRSKGFVFFLLVKIEGLRLVLHRGIEGLQMKLTECSDDWLVASDSKMLHCFEF